MDPSVHISYDSEQIFECGYNLVNSCKDRINHIFHKAKAHKITASLSREEEVNYYLA